MSLVEAIDNDHVILIETNRDYPKFRRVKIVDLIESIMYHGKKNMGGFWLIKSK